GGLQGGERPRAGAAGEHTGRRARRLADRHARDPDAGGAGAGLLPLGGVVSRPLRIAQVAPLYERVPPALYGGTERVVGYLTEELVARGHPGTPFPSGGSGPT